MADITGTLGQTNNYSSVNDLIAQWPTIARNLGIKLSGVAFDGFETDYLDSTVIGNLTFATNDNPKSWLSYSGEGGIGTPSAYDGWFTDPIKVRAEINHNPNTNQSQMVKVKWADNQNITNTTIDLSGLNPQTSPGLGDQGNEVGFLQLFNNGVVVPTTNFTFTRVNPPSTPKPLSVSSDGVTFIGDRTDGSFQFNIAANPASTATFDEVRFSTKAYDNATPAYSATSFKDDGSDYLVRKIEYQGTEDPVSLQFSAPTFSVNEDGTTVAAVTVTRVGSSAGTASATLNLTNGTATAPGDYNNTAIPVNFANGDTAAKTIVIPIVDDTAIEGNENVNLSLTNPTGTSRVTLGTQSTATLNIVDNDIAGTLQFSAPTFSVNEDGTTVAAVTVTRTGGSAGAVSATVNLANGTATAPGDYTGTAIPVNFAAGDTAPKTVTIPIANDTLVEATETVSLTLASPTGGATIGTQNAATLSIADDDSSLQFSAPTFSLNEDGTAVAAVTVTRTGSSTAAASATVNLANGTATAPGDYNNAGIPVNFAAGDSTPKTVTIPIVNDTLVEGTETLNLTLANPTGATIGTQGTATVNIADDDSTLQFSAPTFSLNEDGTAVAAVTVTRTGSTTAAASATVNLANGTATAPGDYTNTPIAVNFAAGDSAPKTVTIPIVNDTSVEPTETLNLTLANPTGATIGTQGTATVNIADDDSTLQFSAPTFSLNEDGTAVAAVTVTRTGSSTAAASATVNLANGTATAPGDYNNAGIPVNFAAGDSTPKTVTIPIVNDTLVEPTETLNLTLANPTGATIGTQGTATLSIADDDSSLQFSAPTFRVNENGRAVAAVTVTRTGNITGAVSATVNLADGTATAPGDYNNAGIPVNFAAGDSAPKIIDIPIVNDTLVEGTERVNLSLTNPTGNASIGTQGTAILNIADNDSSLQFSAPTFSVNENGTPIAAVTVTRIGSGNGAVSATVNLTDGTATAPGDYTGTPIPVNFAAGDTAPKTVNIPIVDDILLEINETVNLSLTNPTGNASIGTQSTATLNIADNDSSLQFSAPTFRVNENGTTVAAVTVTRTGNSNGAVSATVNLNNATAIAPDDYSNVPIAVNFASGDSAPKIIDIPIVNDTLVEGTERVNLSLTNPTGNTLIGTQSTAILNIGDDDSTLQFSSPIFSVNEDGTPIAAVTVTRTGNANSAVSATVNLTNGSAIAPFDYTTTPIAVDFASGDSAPKTLNMLIVDDFFFEGTETVNLSLTNPTGSATIGTQSTATLDIVDNDVFPFPIAPLAAASIVPESDITNFRSASAEQMTVGVPSTFMSNSVNPVAGSPTLNWWDLLPGSIVGGIRPNQIVGASPGLATSNPFANSVL